jgi:predicted nucleic acid-binding protein
MVLGVAISGDADAMITGDKDLLTLKRYKGSNRNTPHLLGNQAKTGMSIQPCTALRGRRGVYNL